MLRKSFFWAHLIAGFCVGFFVLTMSVTGVFLTYEAQIVDFAVARAVKAPEADVPLDPDAMVLASLAGGGQPGHSLVLSRQTDAPAKLLAGRESIALDPYTGAPLEDAGAATKAFFAKVTALHRWLSVSGPTEVGGAVISAANLVFLFLVASGLYLWLPPILRWRRLKFQLLFRRGLPSPQARHYNWHHVFGIWALVPLFVITLSGVVMSYSWANTLVFTAFGEQAPQGRPGGPPGLSVNVQGSVQGSVMEGLPQPYSTLLESAAADAPDWKRATIVLPAQDDVYLQVTMDEGNGVQSSAKTQLVFDRMSGESVTQTSGATGTRGMRLRGWFRFVHTGEIYGILGQTIAGLASLAALILVYTGASLGIRRLARMWRQR